MVYDTKGVWWSWWGWNWQWKHQAASEALKPRLYWFQKEDRGDWIKRKRPLQILPGSQAWAGQEVPVMCADLVVLMFVVETGTYGFGAWFVWYLIWTGRNCVVEIGMEDDVFPQLLPLPLLQQLLDATASLFDKIALLFCCNIDGCLFRSKCGNSSTRVLCARKQFKRLALRC